MPEWPAIMSFAEILPAHVSPSAGNYCFKYDDDEAIYVITTAKLSNHFQTPCLMGVYIYSEKKTTLQITKAIHKLSHRTTSTIQAGEHLSTVLLHMCKTS